MESFFDPVSFGAPISKTCDGQEAASLPCAHHAGFVCVWVSVSKIGVCLTNIVLL